MAAATVAPVLEPSRLEISPAPAAMAVQTTVRAYCTPKLITFSWCRGPSAEPEGPGDGRPPRRHPDRVLVRKTGQVAPEHVRLRSFRHCKVSNQHLEAGGFRRAPQ